MGVTADKRQDYTDAYAFYLALTDKGAEYAEMAEQATPYQLLELKRCRDKKSDALYDSARFFYSKGRMPSVKLLCDYKNNQVNRSFKPVQKISPNTYNKPELPDVPELNSYKQPAINPVVSKPTTDVV